MDRKQAAWKKSRKFGDVYGGRERVKLEDNIFDRAHSLKRPELTDDLPILIEGNPSGVRSTGNKLKSLLISMRSVNRRQRNMFSIDFRKLRVGRFIKSVQLTVKELFLQRAFTIVASRVGHHRHEN